MMPTSLKNRWSLSNNSLAGIPADRWWQLLKENDFAIDPAYYHRFAFLTVLSLVNLVYRRKEERLYGEAIEKTDVSEPPIFILGHYRSGTTHLHYLLAIDEQFGYPTTYQSAHAYSFICGEARHARVLEPFLDDKRPMDNMALGMRTPQEEEYALSLASLCSPFLSYSFPRRYNWYQRYLTFNDVSRQEIARWKAALRWFVKKLTLRYGRRLVLKCPPNTSRIRLILEVFPDARFVHICRDPYTVYRSTRHLYSVVPWYMYLQRPDVGYTDDRIIDQYTQMYDSYFRDKALIPAGHLHEMHFEALEEDPVGEVRGIYEALGLAGFEEMRPKLERYLDSISGYVKGAYPGIPAPLRARLAASWRRCFEAWGYPA